MPGFRPLPDGGIGGAWPEDDPTAGTSRPGIAQCPDGWSRLADGTCDPMMRTDCPLNSAALPGGRCTPTADVDCPAGDYPPLGPEALGEPAVHVRAGADATVADGSVAHPFATVNAGIAAVGDRGHVLVAAGTYQEHIRVPSGVIEVAGVCAARVTLDGTVPTADALPTFNSLGPDTVITLRGLTVRGTGYGIQTHFGAHLVASGLVVTDSAGVGVLALEPGTVVDLSDSVVQHVTAGNGASGHGIEAQGGATLTVRDVAVLDSTRFAVMAQGVGTALDLTAMHVGDTRPGVDGMFGVAVAVYAGASVTGHALVINGSHHAGIQIYGAGTTAALSEVIVRGTQRDQAYQGGHGVEATLGATAHMADILVDDNLEAGVLTTDVGTRLDLETSVVRNTRPVPGGGSGLGISAGSGSALHATGVLVDGNSTVGVEAAQPGTTLVLASSAVRNTQENTRLRVGYGSLVTQGAAARITAVAFDGNVGAGVIAGIDGSTLDIAGVAIRGTLPTSQGVYGRALVAADGGAITATGALLQDNTEAALVSYGLGTVLTAWDVLVQRVAPSAGGFGLGVLASDGGRLDGGRVAVASVGGAALAVIPYDGLASTVTLQDLFIHGVRASTLQVDDQGGVLHPSGAPVAYGLHTALGCTVRVDRAVIDTGDYGFFNSNGTVVVHQGVITRQRQALGSVAAGTPPAATVLDRVWTTEDAVNRVLQRNDLPTASSLAAPLNPCADGC